MKRLVSTVLILTLLFCLCSCGYSGAQAVPTVNELPANAENVSTLAVTGSSGSGVTENEYMVPADMSGYFIVKVQYESGSATGMKLSLIGTSTSVLLKISDSKKSAMYTTETMNFTADNKLQIGYSSLSDYKAEVSLYFVPSESS